uniref:Uncharacterized protein ycf20 n=1 Tax=Bulboplastis apyrenoidosa TaxID=1070855 RepID=A0A1Y9TMC2_9RHOD|nr:conserved hypothetical plastid protein [Bulboplastis apyrenoidosa]ARO90802.1 conserved hypothetical plastid protein [Bulboplastis apyrenoidosa]
MYLSYKNLDFMNYFYNIPSIQYYSVGKFIIYLLSLLLGFFFATILSTMPSQTNDWCIVSSSIVVSITEIMNKYIYNNEQAQYKQLIKKIINCLKIGILYGLFVYKDSFQIVIF